MSGIPGTPSTGNPVARNVVAAALASAIDGETVMQSGLPYGGSGIVVAIPEHSVIIRDTMAWPIGAVRRWVDTVAPAVTARSLRPRAFGAWRAGGDLYLDVVEIFSDDEEAAAVAAGHARNQIAIWHAGRQEVIPTGGTGV